MIYTVFPVDTSEMPQDFSTFEEALSFAVENFGEGEFVISSTSGECV